jgi:hypothetical protein
MVGATIAEATARGCQESVSISVASAIIIATIDATASGAVNATAFRPAAEFSAAGLSCCVVENVRLPSAR